MKDALTKEKDRIIFLRNKIREYNYQYFSLNNSVISDQEFDKLFEELKRLEKRNPDFFSLETPIIEVGSDLITLFPEEPHKIPMLSLNKVYNEEDLIKWLNKTGDSFSLEPKMDGVSLILHYEDGSLIKALTRGNGKVGSLITDNVKTIQNIPHKLTKKDSVIVRGEVFLLKTDFEKINESQEIKLANPRNLVAGTLRRQDKEQVASVPLNFIAYEGFWDKSSYIPLTHRESLLRLSQLGFSVSRDILFIGKQDLLSLEESFLGWSVGDRNLDSSHWLDLKKFIADQIIKRDSLDYEVDGLVLKVDNLELRERLGYTSHHPRWALALKFSFQEAETTIEDILVQIGRTGRVTPLALVKPVYLAGVTVSRVTLHNEDFIYDLCLKVGDTVSISRRGDVIPAVESVVESVDGLPWEMPKLCPFCSFSLIKEGAHHFCSNEECPERIKAQLVFFAGKKQMDITSLSSKTIELFFNKGFIKEEADFYKLDYEVLESLEGIGKKKIEQLKKALHKSKSQPFKRIMISLGLKDMGDFVINSLLEAGYSSFTSYIELVEAEDFLDKFTSIKGLGKKLAISFQKEILSPSLRKRVKDLEEVGFSFQEDILREKEPLGDLFKGNTWCITGVFQHFKNREVLRDLILQQGGKVSSSLTREVTHLLVGEKAGSKRDKGKNMDIEIIEEKDFVASLKSLDKNFSPF